MILACAIVLAFTLSVSPMAMAIATARTAPAITPVAGGRSRGSLDAAVKKHNAQFTLPNGTKRHVSKPRITFINRHVERLRGFQIFLRALPARTAAIPDVQVSVIGTDTGGGYGGKLANNVTGKQKMLAEVEDQIDQDCLHCVGKTSHSAMITAVSLS